MAVAARVQRLPAGYRTDGHHGRPQADGDGARCRDPDDAPHGNGVAVFQAATLQFSAICEPTHLQELQAGHYEKTKALTDSAWVYKDGGFILPDRPGLGVEVDEDALQGFIVKE